MEENTVPAEDVVEATPEETPDAAETSESFAVEVTPAE